MSGEVEDASVVHVHAEYWYCLFYGRGRPCLVFAVIRGSASTIYLIHPACKPGGGTGTPRALGTQLN